MTLDQLKYFLAIYNLKSFSKASEELCISQSSISKQIKSLENELNITLFKRTTRSLIITPQAEKFKSFAEETLTNYDIFINSLNSDKEKISIATIPVILQYGIASLISEFKKNYPNIEVEINELEHLNIIDSIEKFESSLAFIRTENISLNSLNIHNLLEDELVLVTSKNHPLAKKKYVNLKEFKNDNFILLGKSSGVYNSCIKAFKEANFTPNIIYCNSRIESIIGLVSQNLGVTLVMGKIISYFNNPNLNIILLKNPIKSSLGIVSLKNKKLSKNEILFKNFSIKWFKNK